MYLPGLYIFKVRELIRLLHDEGCVMAFFMHLKVVRRD